MEYNNTLPRHIAIIMDGNGRWAKKRGLPRKMGHAAGAETFRRIATYCKNIGVKYLTVYAFSTENWKRSEVEVSAIMALLKRYLLEAVDTMEKDHIRLHFFGDMTPIAPDLRALARETDEITEHLSKDDFQANVCRRLLRLLRRRGQGRKLLQFEIGVCSHPVLVQDPQDLISAEAGNAQKQAEKEPAAPALHTPSSFAQSFQRRLRSSSFCSGVIR